MYFEVKKYSIDLNFEIWILSKEFSLFSSVPWPVNFSSTGDADSEIVYQPWSSAIRWSGPFRSLWQMLG